MSTSAPSRRPKIAFAIDRAGLVLALAAAVLKATVSVSSFPGWELDPFTFFSPFTGLGPTGAMICDGVMALGVLLMLFGRWMRGAMLGAISIVLFCAGTVGVLLHMWPTYAHTIAEQWIGSSWIAAMLLGLAIATMPRDAQGNRTRIIAGAVFLGFVTLLAVRGGQQFIIEHPETVANFRRNRESIFAAQGWSPDSPMAKTYERRLMQPEATGWFGLANVYATFAAAGTVMALVIGARAVRTLRHQADGTKSSKVALGAFLAVSSGVGALFFAGAKGGYIAAALGVLGAACLEIAGSPRIRARLGNRVGIAGGILGAAVLAGVFSLVALRGIAGDRIGELSLLFRWFYMQAAARIGLEHLPLGVGPDGFQQAYMLAKNPLSTEDVTSSHNLLLDWFATLGIFGLAWAALWVVWAWRAGAGAVLAPAAALPDEPEADDSARHDRWTLIAIGVLATVAAIRLDQDVLTPDLAGARLAGLIVFCLVGSTALAVFRRDERTMRLALAGAAMAAAAHSLIDVTGVWPTAAPMLCMLIGTAATPPVGSAPFFRMRRALAMISAVGVLAAASLLPVTRVYLWETWLKSAARTAGEVSMLHQRWQEIIDGMRLRRPGAPEEARALAAELSVKTLEPQAIENALRIHELNRMDRTLLIFEKLRQFPTEWKVRREASRVELRRASLLRLMGRESEAAAAEANAEVILTQDVDARNQTSSELAWTAIVLESKAQGPEERQQLQKAAATLEKAAFLAPYELEHATRLMRIYARLGDTEGAGRWATRALQLDEGLKYDREIKALKPADRDEARRLSTGS